MANFTEFLGIFRTLYLKRQQQNGLKLGKNVRLERDAYIDHEFCWLISIGDDCIISSGVKILAHDASHYWHSGTTKVDKVTIGCRTFVGANSIILPGVKIGSNSIIGAGSVVTKDVPDRSVVAGNPARLISTIPSFVEKHRTNLATQVVLLKNREMQSDESKRKVLDALNKGLPCYIRFDFVPDDLGSIPDKK